MAPDKSSLSHRLFETTAQRIAASQTAVQRKQTSRLARHLKLSVLAGLTASGQEKRQQAVSHTAHVDFFPPCVCMRHLSATMASSISLNYATDLQDRQLADEAHWCRQYAKINAVALRKILEQHDRMLHNNSGQHLLQVGLTYCCEKENTFLTLDFAHSICHTLYCASCEFCSSLLDSALAHCVMVFPMI